MRTLIIREGEILSVLKRKFDELGIEKACITSGIGFVKNVKLGFFKEWRYQECLFSGPFELLSAIGHYENGKVHLHVVLGKEDYSTIGGHLLSAEVALMVQVSFKEVKEVEEV